MSIKKDSLKKWIEKEIERQLIDTDNPNSKNDVMDVIKKGLIIFGMFWDESGIKLSDFVTYE